MPHRHRGFDLDAEVVAADVAVQEHEAGIGAKQALQVGAHRSGLGGIAQVDAQQSVAAEVGRKFSINYT